MQSIPTSNVFENKTDAEKGNTLRLSRAYHFNEYVGIPVSLSFSSFYCPTSSYLSHSSTCHPSRVSFWIYVTILHRCWLFSLSQAKERSGTPGTNAKMAGLLLKPQRRISIDLISHQRYSTTLSTSCTTNETLKRCCLVSKPWVPRIRKRLFAGIEFRSVAALELWNWISLILLRIILTPCWLVALRTSRLQVQNRVVGFGHFFVSCGWGRTATWRNPTTRWLPSSRFTDSRSP